MAKHQYSNTTSADLWAALENASGKPVAKLASDWTTQPGFPLIQVAQRCEDGKRKVMLTQRQFRLDEPATENRLWSVPLQVGTVGGKAAWTLLSGPSMTLTQGSCEGALVVDPASVAFVRIQYDPASFEALSSQAARLPDPTRLKLLADTWALATAGSVPLDSYLKLVRQYRDEPRLAVWEAILANLNTLDALARGEPERPLVRRFIADFVKPKFTRLGWEEKPGDSVEDIQLRALLANALARAGDPDAIAQAKGRFQRYLADPNTISPAVSPSLIDFVIGTASRYADASTYAALERRLTETQSNEERNRIGRALSQVEDPVLAGRALAFAVSPAMPPTLSAPVVQGVAREHLAQAWAFAVANRDALMKNQEPIFRNKAIPGIVAGSANPADAEMMEDYVRKNFDADAQVEAQRVANGVRVRVRAAQKARLLPQVRSALQ
jgi:aminopeptidase N